MIFENINEAKDRMIFDIQKKSDEVFRQILKTMIKNYSHLDTEGIIDPNQIDLYLQQASSNQVVEHQDFQGLFPGAEQIMDQQINSYS
tara:strand:+ start:282 stop:545 length:264 start_codon:yes stop_codon:yes gene_type:complete